MKITEVNKEDMSLLGLRGRPLDYTKSKYYPAIKKALNGKLMCIECLTDKEGASLYNTINGILRRNKIKLNMCLRKEKLYLYKK